MTQNRKYYGMTSTQIGILAALAGVACLLFGLAAWFLLRGNASPLAFAPEATPIPQSTSTPFAIPTLAATETPTAIPYEVLVPEGWVQFKTTLVEIWLPKEFKREDSKASDEPATLELEMRGFASESSLYPVLVMIYYEPLTVGSLDIYVDNSLAKLSADTRVTERRKVTINSVDAVRISMEARYEGIDATAAYYIFLDGGTVWIVQYFAQINDFYTLLDTFEKSVKTFRVVR